MLAWLHCTLWAGQHAIRQFGDMATAAACKRHPLWLHCSGKYTERPLQSLQISQGLPNAAATLMADLFDSALNLEEQHIQEGYEEGVK